MSTDPKDHDAREVEALAKELWKEYAATCKASHWDADWILDSTRDGFRSAARFVLAREARLVEALERLARLGNGDRLGTSIGNVIAQEALAREQAKP